MLPLCPVDIPALFFVCYIMFILVANKFDLIWFELHIVAWDNGPVWRRSKHGYLARRPVDRHRQSTVCRSGCLSAASTRTTRSRRSSCCGPRRDAEIAPLTLSSNDSTRPLPRTRWHFDIRCNTMWAKIWWKSVKYFLRYSFGYADLCCIVPKVSVPVVGVTGQIVIKIAENM